MKSTLKSPWSDVAAHLGGVAQLAKALGCNVATLWRWSTGRTIPHKTARMTIDALFKSHGIEPPVFF